jgi:site-specific recombinase XerD
VPPGMEEQVVDRSTLQNLVNITDPEDLVRGYIVACRCDGKSPKTISSYEALLNDFLWHCQQKDYHVLAVTPLHMTQRYLQSLKADDAVNAHRKFSPLDNMSLR